MTPLVIVTGVSVIACAVLLLAVRYPGLGAPIGVAALLRVIVGFVGYHAVPFEIPYADDDARFFEIRAWRIASGGWASVADAWNPLDGFDMVAPFALIYRVLGRQPHALIFYNVLLGVLTVALAFLIGRALGGRRLAVRCGWAMALFPAAILMSSVLLRESGIGFGVALGVFGFIEAQKRRQLVFVLLGVAGFGFASLLHGGVLPAAAVSLLALAFSQTRGVLDGGRIRPRTAMVAVAALILTVAAIGTFTSREIRLPSVGAVSLETLESQLIQEDPREAEGGSSYWSNTATAGWGQAVLQLPARLALFMWSPLPWTVRSPSQIVGLLDGLFWMLMVFAVGRHGRALWRDPSARLVLWFLIIALATYALGTTNAGTALRHRTKLIPAFLPLAIFALRTAGIAESEDR